jgi:Tfp pilus assembly protein PilV
MAETKKLHKFIGKISGFTLMEVTIAVLILSTALITLLGLQSSILKRSLRDEEKQQAMLLARTILSAIEVKNKDIDDQDSTTTVEALFEKLQLNLKDEGNEENIKKFSFMAHLKVENVSVKDVGDNLMKSVSLTIYSKDAATDADGQIEDAFEVVYLIPLEDDSAV